MANNESNTKPMPVTQSNPPAAEQAKPNYGDNQASKVPINKGVR